MAPLPALLLHRRTTFVGPHMFRPAPFFLFMALLLAACEKEITVELPEEAPQLVVEGFVEPGLPPIVILTRSQGFFDPLAPEVLAGVFVRNALVTVDQGDGPVVLDQLCTASLSAAQRELLTQVTGLDPDLAALVDLCIYTTGNTALFGEVGRTYRLRIESGGEVLTSVTTIPVPVALDSLWFQPRYSQSGSESAGFLWGRITDPAGLGNAYRWYDRRISSRGLEAPDALFRSGGNNTFNDRYFDGGNYQFSVNGFRFPGDTVVVRFVSIGELEYRFYRSFEANVNSGGDLLGTPQNAESNITGGLGVWVGRGVYTDTVVCQ